MALTDKYVTVTGAGDKSGSSTGNAMSWAELKTAMEAGGGAVPGDRYNIQEGTYTLAASDAWAISGTTTAPIIIRGCKSDWTPIEPTRNASTGLLDTTNMPYINYNGAVSLAATSASYIIFKSLRLSCIRSAATLNVGNTIIAYGLSVSNSQSNSAARALLASGTNCTFIMCDCSCSDNTTTGPVIELNANANRVIGCVISDGAAQGIYIQNTNSSLVLGNVIYGLTGATAYGIYVNITTAANHCHIINNTIYGGLGIGFADTAISSSPIILNNHITDSTNGILGPATANATVLLANNRTRNNSGGAVTWVGDWDEATTWNHVTSFTGDGTNALQDYISIGNFNLRANAPGRGTGVPQYTDIGGLQRKEPRPGSNLIDFSGGLDG